MPKPTPVTGLGADTPIAEAAPRLIGARLADARRYEAPLREAREVDPVHDMRVATRRLRAAIRHLGGDDLVERERATKVVQDALGGVRDIHVQVERLQTFRPHLDGQAADAVTALIDEERAKLPEKERRLVEALEVWSRETADPLAASLAILDYPAGTLGGRAMTRRIGHLLQRVDRDARHALLSPDAPTAHRLRISVKKLRYAVELVEPATPRVMATLLEALVPLQEQLGDLHDEDVRVALLEDFARRAPPPLREGALAAMKAIEKERDKMAGALVAELNAMQAERLMQRLERFVD